jgi:valyl-tRNA synthetase
VPERFEKVWEHWLTNIRDWNVSRQLWWGHRIPAWYCPDGHITVTSAEAGPDACGVCGRPASALQQEPDIFDTWFSSGLWPFSTLGWPDDTADLRTYYPTSVMETGHDILFFWVARMMMLGLHLTDKPPFRTVYLSGLVRDDRGQRMSKTKGNVVDPLQVMAESGADALRFALIHGATPGQDQKFGAQKLETGRTFANKLWNATRFVLGARPESIDRDAPRRPPEASHLGLAERWIRSRTAATIEAADRGIEEYQLAELTRALYDGIWSEFCDWGLEMAKARLSDASLPVEEREATWWTLVESLHTFIRLLHPVMPYVTEALWAALPHDSLDPELVIVARWPAPMARDAAAESAVGGVLDLIRAIRNARAEAGIEPGAWLPARVTAPAESMPDVAALAGQIERLARIRGLRLSTRGDAPEASAGAGATAAGGAGAGGDAIAAAIEVVAGRLEASLEPAAGDKSASSRDRERLERELALTEDRLAAARARLADPRFTERAPAPIVAGARSSEADLAAQVASLREKLAP